MTLGQKQTMTKRWHSTHLKVGQKRHCSVLVKARRSEAYECHTVFQSSHVLGPITIQDVDDHMAAVKHLKDRDKLDYFSAHGMDYKRCDEYINVVKYLNRCYNKKLKAEAESHKMHWTIIPALAFICSYIQEELHM